MRGIEKVKVNIPSFANISGEYELGDLTIFIGRANSGKTRILDNIWIRLHNLHNNASNYLQKEQMEHEYQRNGIFLTNLTKKALSVVYVKSLRPNVDSIHALGLRLAKNANAAKIIDPSIHDLGTNIIQFSNGETRPLIEQGSGLQNQTQVLNKLNGTEQIVLIDEPEISQFPYGKIEILKNIIRELNTKQIIIATHDPTIINQFLIKSMLKEETHKILIYSFCGDKFEKIDFDSNLDPEIHVGYLSQTYSGKPVHLIVEGLTEYYMFQSLITKFCIHYKIPHFPKYINKIAISHISGSQWKIHLHHLPDPRFYRVLVLLDGEHSKDLKDIASNQIYNKINIVNDIVDVQHREINFITLNNKNIEEVFKQEFGQNFDKPLGLSEKILSLTEEQFKKIDFNKKDLKLIKNIIIWCLKNTGADISQFDLKNEFIEQYIEKIKKENTTLLFDHDFIKKARNLDMDEEEIKKAYHKILQTEFDIQKDKKN